jgi:hypothetical protein
MNCSGVTIYGGKWWMKQTGNTEQERRKNPPQPKAPNSCLNVFIEKNYNF